MSNNPGQRTINEIQPGVNINLIEKSRFNRTVLLQAKDCAGLYQLLDGNNRVLAGGSLEMGACVTLNVTPYFILIVQSQNNLIYLNQAEKLDNQSQLSIRDGDSLLLLQDNHYTFQTNKVVICRR